MKQNRSSLAQPVFMTFQLIKINCNSIYISDSGDGSILCSSQKILSCDWLFVREYWVELWLVVSLKGVEQSSHLTIKKTAVHLFLLVHHQLLHQTPPDSCDCSLWLQFHTLIYCPHCSTIIKNYSNHFSCPHLIHFESSFSSLATHHIIIC